MYRKYRLQFLVLTVIILFFIARNGLLSTNYSRFELNFDGMIPIQGARATVFFYTPIYLLTILVEQEKMNHTFVYYENVNKYLSGLIRAVYVKIAIVISSFVALCFFINLTIFYSSSLWLQPNILLNIMLSIIIITGYLVIFALFMEILKMWYNPLISLLLALVINGYMYLHILDDLYISNIFMLSYSFESSLETILTFTKAAALICIYYIILSNILGYVQGRKDII